MQSTHGCQLGNTVREHHSQRIYADIVTDYVEQGAKSIQLAIDEMKPATLRTGLRRVLKSKT